MNTFYKNLSLWLVIGVIMVLLFNLFQGPQAPSGEMAFSEFLVHVDDGDVGEVVIQERDIAGRLKDGTAFHTYAADYPDLVQDLKKEGVAISARPPKQTPLYLQVLLSWAPFILLFGVWIFFMRQMQGGGNRALSFGKSRAKLQTGQSQKVTFDDVAGIPEAKAELTEIVEFLKDPKKFQELGGRIPRGVLLMGAPGTGKTLLAKAIAGEAGVPFFAISGSEFVEMFVGVGAARVRDLFEQARKAAPAVIFIDEIDAIGQSRAGAVRFGGNDEREQTLNQLLAEIDGFQTGVSAPVIIMAATNRPEVLDPALMRAGRFDRQVAVGNPDLIGREQILRIHSRGIKLVDDFDIGRAARMTPGFSGADLANVMNEAALLAARRNAEAVTLADFEAAIERVVAGLEQRTRVMNEQERRAVAYHESGHAMLAELTPHGDPVSKISIVPRSRGSLGFTMQMPTEDRYLLTVEELQDRIAVMLGGRAAEKVVFDRISTGASDDILRATELARRMVTEFGMSELLGSVRYAGQQLQYLGGAIEDSSNLSPKTRELIDAEVQRIVTEQYERARALLTAHRAALETLARRLLEQETLDGCAVQEALGVEEPEC